MKWSVLKEWVSCCQVRGMWQSRQPLAGLTGQGVMASRGGRSPCEEPGGRAGIECAAGFDAMAAGPGSAAWQERHLASFLAVSVSALRCGSWQVTQLSFPSLFA